MSTIPCPLCNEPVEVMYHPALAGTYYDPAEPEEYEFEPTCACHAARCVDSDSYFEWLAEIAVAKDLGPPDDGDLLYDLWKEMQV
jgi:hypothetical protein